jgi:hypothetical protein
MFRGFPAFSPVVMDNPSVCIAQSRHWDTETSVLFPVFLLLKVASVLL